MLNAGWLLLAVPLLTVQIFAAQASFDVASLKPSGPSGDTYTANLGTIKNGELVLENATLADCLKFAYGLVSDEQMSGPDWIFSKAIRFDVIGKALPSTSRDQMRLMLQTLLDERFNLKMHFEARKISHYALVLARTGSKMRETDAASAISSVSHTGKIQQPAMLMHSLALLLSRQMHEMVLDETGLSGWYAVSLSWTPEGAETEQGASIFTALQEQLGLKLVLNKDPVDILIVDSAAKTPAGN